MKTKITFDYDNGEVKGVDSVFTECASSESVSSESVNV